ncbi:uncharacterized protein LOC135344968 isoform X3 [Halichondria panicea]|uniref:uncharacterized protein LOC135344968 isoform X3 n=1 Tax=Halichondria panicea TaxID=6063 RepID=UPI00312B4627
MATEVLEGFLPTRRKNYTREEKMLVISWHHENGRKIYQTAKHFLINTKSIIRWLKNEAKIRSSKEGSMRVTFTKANGTRSSPRKKTPQNSDIKLREQDSVVLGRYSNRSTTGLEESMRVQPFDADRSSTVSLTGHLAIPAKLRCSKGNRTNETLILLQVAEPPMLAPSLLSSITDPPSPSHSHSSDDSSSSSPPTKRKRRPEANKTSEILLKILSEVSNKEKELDEEALFALQVAANLRRLSSRQKATAKIKIQQVLLEIEFPTET